MGYKKLSIEQELALVEDYRNGASVKSLMEKYGFASKKSITDKVKKHYPDSYAKIVKEAQENRKDYCYDLEKITCNFDAYFIGLMLTDGYVTEGRRIGIDLTDEDCIAFLANSIGTKYSTYEPESGNELIEAKLPRHRLIMSDRALVSQLSRFGVIEHKTENLQPPQLDKDEQKYLPYLIRGIIDGDGCVFSTSYGAPAFYIAVKSKDFVNWLNDIFTNYFYMMDMRVTDIGGGMYRIETANQQNILKLISIVYDKPYGMSRKYTKLRKMFRDYNSDLLLEEYKEE